MKLFRPALALLLAVCGLVGLRAVTPQMPVDEIRPGMVGIGRTVFAGTQVEEFKAHILGVLENVIGTHRNLILARLEGGPLANTGVIAGMSGSPVYIDGRLIGAVSYSLGQFSKEPIAGITPIAEMTDAASFGDARPPGGRVHIEFPLTNENLAAALHRTFARTRSFVAAPGEAQLAGATAVSGLNAGQLGTLLRPIATPLVMAGFDPEVNDLLGQAFGSEGFVPTGAASAGFHAGEMPFDGPLKPGDAVGVMLVNGDLQLGGTGTVTHIDDDRVYAFGHPFYNLGPTEFPMTRAYVYTVLPSLLSSMKLSSTGEVIGTFLQDRATAISGRLGAGPHMIPISLTLSSAKGPARTFHFDVVNDQLLTPLAAYVSILNTLGSYGRQVGSATFDVRGKATLTKHDDIVFDNMFTGDQAANGVAGYVVAPLTYLMGNDYEKVDIAGIDLRIASTEEPKTATVERVWLDDPRPRAGHTVPLKVLLRTYRGDDVIRTLPIEIPINASGSLALMVSDGGRLTQIEQRETRLAQQPRNVDQVIKALNKGRRNSILYVRLLGTDAGAVVNGERLPSLPPSVLGVLESDRNGGTFNPLQSATLAEWELPTDQAVSGSRTLAITISPN
jgi:hypothetical protein